MAVSAQSRWCRVLRTRWRIATLTLQKLLEDKENSDEESSPSMVGLDGLACDVASRMGRPEIKKLFTISLLLPRRYLPSLILLLGRFDAFFSIGTDRSHQLLQAALLQLSRVPIQESHGVSVLDIMARTAYRLCEQQEVRQYVFYCTYPIAPQCTYP